MLTSMATAPPKKLSFSMRAMLGLLESGTATIGELSSKSRHSPQYVSRLVSEFSNNNLATIKVSPSDRRIHIISITTKGRNALR